MYLVIKQFIEHKYFKNFIISLIIINGITMGLETSQRVVSQFGHLLELFDTLVIAIFTIEITLRIYIYRVSFFKDGWSIFDFIIVAISLLPANSGFEILRVLRVLRLFRLVTTIPQMKKVVSALLKTIPGMSSIIALMGIFFYVFAIMATNLYGKTHPEFFGDLGKSFYTLFQIMTLESWSAGIVRPLMEEHPYAWVFFIPFIFVATFIMINLIVAIVVDAMNEINSKSEEKIDDELKELKIEIQELKKLLQEKKETS